MFDAVGDRLLEPLDSHALEMDVPTLQSPGAVLESLMLSEWAQMNPEPEDTVEVLKREIQQAGGLTAFLAHWILQFEGEEEHSLQSYIEAVTGCWKIGQTYEFSILRDDSR